MDLCSCHRRCCSSPSRCGDQRCLKPGVWRRPGVCCHLYGGDGLRARGGERHGAGPDAADCAWAHAGCTASACMSCVCCDGGVLLTSTLYMRASAACVHLRCTSIPDQMELRAAGDEGHACSIQQPGPRLRVPGHWHPSHCPRRSTASSSCGRSACSRSGSSRGRCASAASSGSRRWCASAFQHVRSRRAGRRCSRWASNVIVACCACLLCC
jgi:hypothetical protein